MVWIDGQKGWFFTKTCQNWSIFHSGQFLVEWTFSFFTNFVEGKFHFWPIFDFQIAIFGPLYLPLTIEKLAFFQIFLEIWLNTKYVHNSVIWFDEKFCWRQFLRFYCSNCSSTRQPLRNIFQLLNFFSNLITLTNLT